jgi:hypothetical protein
LHLRDERTAALVELGKPLRGGSHSAPCKAGIKTGGVFADQARVEHGARYACGGRELSSA